MGSFFSENAPPDQYGGGSFSIQRPVQPQGNTPFYLTPGQQQAFNQYQAENGPTSALNGQGSPSSTQNTGVTGGGMSASPQGGAGGDYQAEFQQAVQELGIAPGAFRGNPQIMDQVTNYLNQKYPGQNWTNGGARAGDWVSANGQGFDVLPAGDRNWQWLSDPANSTAGSDGSSAGGMNPYALQALGSPTQQIENTPGYQFSVQQAMDAIQHSAAARGTLLSGGLMKNLGAYIGNVVAGPAYQQRLANLYNISGLGEKAASLGGQDYANAASGLLTGIGSAQAAGSAAQGNIWGGAANNLGQIASSSYLATQNPYTANANGYNPAGVNGYGVTTIPATPG